MSGRSHRKGEETVDSGLLYVVAVCATLDDRIADDGQSRDAVSTAQSALTLQLTVQYHPLHCSALCCHLFALARTTLWNDRGIEWRS